MTLSWVLTCITLTSASVLPNVWVRKVSRYACELSSRRFICDVPNLCAEGRIMYNDAVATKLLATAQHRLVCTIRKKIMR